MLKLTFDNYQNLSDESKLKKEEDQKGSSTTKKLKLGKSSKKLSSFFGGFGPQTSKTLVRNIE